MTTNPLPNGDGVAAGAIFVVWLIVLKLSGNLEILPDHPHNSSADLPLKPQYVETIFSKKITKM